MFKTVMKHLYAVYAIIICVIAIGYLLIGVLEGLNEADISEFSGVEQFGFMIGALIGVGLIFPVFHAVIAFIRVQLRFLLPKGGG